MTAIIKEHITDTHQNISYKEAMALALKEEMQRDERVMLIGEDISLYGCSELVKTFSQSRVRNAPISENSFTGMAIGAAMTGLRPVVDLTVASFIYLASDQIINQASKLRYMTGGQVQVPVVFRASMYYNRSIAAQHSDRPYPTFMNSPGLKIIVPSTVADMKGLLKSAIRDDDPVLIFEDVNLWKEEALVHINPEELVPIGKAAIRRVGNDATIVSIGGCLNIAIKAADLLDKEGLSVEVIDPRTIVPLDKGTLLSSIAKTGRLIIVDNAHRTGSVASEIAAIVAEEAFDSLKAPIQRITTPDVHIPSSPALEKLIYPSETSLVAAVKKLF